MNALSANNLLQVWEKGHAWHPVDRALLLLCVAEPTSTYSQLAEWSIGKRDDAILRLRMATFGNELNAYIDCPTCQVRLEFNFDGRKLLDSDQINQAVIEFEGFQFRLPTSSDLAQIVNERDPQLARQKLLSLCLIEGMSGNKLNWPQILMEEVETRMAKADPKSEIEFDLSCEECGHRWQAIFDIVSFFWDEIEVRARRLLLEIHALASSYGWSEQQILALSDQRRTAYLEMVGL